MSWFLRSLLLCTLAAQSILAATTSATNTQRIDICPSTTINYLTHTLPQQCLASSRTTTSVQDVSELHTDAANATDNLSARPANDTPSIQKAGPEVTGAENSTAGASTHATSSISVTTVIAVPIPTHAVGPALPEIIEEDSPLENSDFLSFEEWKIQNLRNSGQSEHAARGAKLKPGEERTPRPDAQSPLDALGDDAEIDLQFTGFVPDGLETPPGRSASPIDKAPTAPKQKTGNRKKDAGTTFKERFNYASFDCAASILKTNSKAKSPSSVLIENKDSYMLNECAAPDKFLILELCNDLQIDTIVLANFEFFSSIFRLFQVSVSDRYPVKADKWKTLGMFEARNSREVQAFLIEDPVMWARYMRIDFLTHYGSEYYCPVSLVRVHGTTMMEDWKKDQQGGQEDDDETDVELNSMEIADIKSDQAVPTEPAHAMPQQRSLDARESAELPVIANHTVNHDPHLMSSDVNSDGLPRIPAHHEQTLETVRTTPLNATFFIFAPAHLDVCLVHDYTDLSSKADASPETASVAARSTRSNLGDHVSTTTVASSGSVESNKEFANSSSTRARESMQASATASIVPLTTSTDEKPSNASKETSKMAASSSSTSIPPSQAKSSSTDRSRPGSSQTQPSPSSPTMQESFFKSVQKRLQMLESNSSLSLQYIEEQSRSLRDAFRKVEQRQMVKTTTFLDHLNATVLNELREFRQQYDQLWQSTVIELETQRQKWQLENQAMHARLGVLADELIFQKRLSILQMILVVVCLGLALFSRGVINNYLELPLVQSVLSKSGGTRWMSLSGDTSSSAPPLKRIRSAHVIRSKPSGILKTHRRIQSDESNTAEPFSPTETDLYSPPTPVSFDGFSDAGQSTQDEGRVLSSTSDIEFDPSTIERPSTSPPMLTTTFDDGLLTPRSTEDLDREQERMSIDSRLLSPQPAADGSFHWQYEPSHSPSSSVEGFGTSPRSSSKRLKWNLPDG